ncbi:uncharacterized protein RJT20DRAFT_118798 [Scheffersomyces xylosifermentans]|uniref:uncharacterized protein n=1 Tax=Scheffersomyces xylosifermentans TaxID=1304137 RepID=UPI00315D8EA2
MDLPAPYKLLSVLSDEVSNTLTLHPQIATLNQLFLKCLKEPRYQAPLTIVELSSLFKSFYRDLNSLVINIFTSSNSTKKSLIANSEYFNANPKVFDYLLAIANYSTSSIKLLKRSDNDALYQLRIFNYYKFLTVAESIEATHLSLFNSINSGESVTLYDKLFRFDQKDIIYQEFLEEKLSVLRGLQLSFTCFVDKGVSNQDKIVLFLESLTEEELAPIQQNISDLNTVNVTPYSKLKSIVLIHKNLIKLYVKAGFKNSEINNDLLLPSLIYLIIYKLSSRDLYLNFLFIQNFANLFDPYRVEVFPVNLNSSYYPSPEKTVLSTKYRICNLYELLNLNETQDQPQVSDHLGGEDLNFFDNDKDLIHYLAETYMNTGELHYYLTNFEAIIVFLSNITISELLVTDPQDNEVEEVSDLQNKLLLAPISKLVDEELLSHFQFPDGKLSEEIIAKEETEKQQNRSRSSSLMNTISNRINETRSRSNSSILNTLKTTNVSALKESFPTLSSPPDIEAATTSTSDYIDSENTGFAMMRNILGRFGSVSVASFKSPTEEHHPLSTVQDQESVSDDVSLSSSLLQKRSNTLISKLSPNHSRTRSSSLENSNNGNGNAFLNNHSSNNKRNSITAKLTNGVSEFMTKLNSTQQASQLQTSINKNISNSSLHSLEGGESTDALPSLSRRPDYIRSRTASIQIMDKFFNNISANYQQSQQQQRMPSLSSNSEEVMVTPEELIKYQRVDFESLTIKDLRIIKGYYDQLCDLVVPSPNANSNGKAERNGSIDGIFRTNTNGKANDKSNDEISTDSTSL